MFPVIQIGPIALQTPVLFIIVGFWFGLMLAEKLAVNSAINPNDLYNLVFTSLMFGGIGARLIFVLRYLETFILSPSNLFSLNPGLLDPAGGIAVGLVAAMIRGNRTKLPLWSTLDALTPLFAVILVAISLCRIASGDAFGIETSLPWGIYLWGAKRHPTQIYNFTISTFILSIIWVRMKTTTTTLNKPGSSFLLFLAMSSGTILFLEAFISSPLILFMNIRLFQVIAWLIMSLCFWGLLKKNRLEKIQGINHE
jgi:phosphatidylglycerol:prolipoprotein diacylglycerol transferase